ncbi:MAG TPA: IS630 family transposase [Candidatus Limnocylindrales bacterium]|nr:IS630 family transposase [Candidatus Limnocylindrales bacterium]
MPKNLEFNREQTRVKIHSLRESGKTWREIAEATGKSKETVRKIYGRVVKNNSFKEKPRTGRPRKLSERDRRVIVSILRKSEIKTPERVRKEASAHHNIDISESTVRRAFKESGFVARVKKKKPLLSVKHKKKRLAWAKKHNTWTIDDWKNIIWSDETGFGLVSGEGREYNWSKDGDILDDDSVIPTKKFKGGKVMIWGCITYEGVGIACKIDDILDAELYSEILRHELMDTIDYYQMDCADTIFQQDNDPKHTSQKAQDALDEIGLDVMEWPAQSPDLNPIEQYWNHLKKQMRERKKIYATKGELWEALQEELDVINKDLCQKLIASMPERVQAVIKAKGGYTKY